MHLIASMNKTFFFKPQNNQEKTLKGNQRKDGSWPCKTTANISICRPNVYLLLL